MSTTCDTTVFVVDDDPVTRSSLQELLESWELTAEVYADAETFLESYDPDRAGCLVLDLRLPGMNGLELQDWLTAHGIALPIVMITGQGDVATAVSALKSGAVDFIEKPFRAQTLLDSIKTAIARDAEARRRQKVQADISAPLARLTNRELEVLTLLAEGFSLKQVALRLGRSYKTADRHKTNLMRKLEIHDRVELARLAIRAGLLTA